MLSGRTLRAQEFPIGIDTDDFAAMATSAEAVRASQRLSRSLIGRRLIIGVDRLDYTKGITERLRAYEALLQNYPRQRGQVTFVQISAPSREDVPEYLELRRQVEATSGRINGLFSEFDWMPLRYLNRGFTRRTLAGFFRLSRIGLVTPLRDGMNLVAKEYVAAQSDEDPGVLVLSRFAGAADDMDGAVHRQPVRHRGGGRGDAFRPDHAAGRAPGPLAAAVCAGPAARHRAVAPQLRPGSGAEWQGRLLRSSVSRSSAAGAAGCARTARP